MTRPESLMFREVREIPEAVDRLLCMGSGKAEEVADAVRALDPNLAITVARGSSDHICTYLKYASELLLGVPVASVGPSVASIYGASLKLDRALCLSVSQSGQSPDIVEMARSASRDGALSIAVTNDASSPLARGSNHVLDIHAGAERSVAATKTFVTSAVAGLLLLANWKQDPELLKALHDLPKVLSQAVDIRWGEVETAITPAGSLFTLGRGTSLAISNEAALKFKETCQIHAESYSTAEVLHGPVSIVAEGFPTLCFASGDAAEGAAAEIADQIAAKGGRVFATTSLARNAVRIEHVRSGHPLTDPLSLITTFYAMVERVAFGRGIDPDTPRHLKKVTETI